MGNHSTEILLAQDFPLYFIFIPVSFSDCKLLQNKATPTQSAAVKMRSDRLDIWG